MDKLKNVKPKADPWGTPEMFLKFLLLLLTPKLYFRFSRYAKTKAKASTVKP